MRKKRAGLLALLSVALLALAAEPALAQSTGDSTTEEMIWDLNNQLLYVAVPITVLVEAILFYTVWKFRNNESPLPTRENRRLEITWTVATAIILLFVGVASYQVLAQPYVVAQDQGVSERGIAGSAADEEVLEVQVTAQTYSWTFEYPQHDVSNGGTMVLPVDRDIRMNVTSADWLHALHVPGLGLKQDAFPGQSNYLLTRAQNTGEHQLYCAEYCGVGHSDMLGTVEVVSQEEFQNWLDENSDGGDSDGGNETDAPANETATPDDGTATPANGTATPSNAVGA